MSGMLSADRHTIAADFGFAGRPPMPPAASLRPRRIARDDLGTTFASAVFNQTDTPRKRWPGWHNAAGSCLTAWYWRDPRPRGILLR